MNPNDQPPSSEALRSTAIPIAQLSTDVDLLAEKSVHSVITLLWPYSSSTKSLSLLLAEPDFRLRRSNGQVKVVFHGLVAEEVAKTHAGIGDNVYLSLAGSRLVENNPVVQTPGSRSTWELHFDASALLEVWRDSKLLSVVKVDPFSSPPPSDNIPATPSTPATNGNSYISQPLDLTSWKSPAFFERSRKSFGLADTTLDPFTEEDGYIPGKGRKRPRFSMRSNEWRLIDEPESPGENTLPDWTVIFDEELATASDAGEESTAQAEIEQRNDHITENANFLRPDDALKNVPELTKRSDSGEVTHLPTDTPRLHPVPSPGLPDPSPLVTSNSPSGYFSPVVEADIAVQSTTPLVSASEATPKPGESTTPPQIQSDGEAVQIDEDDAVTVYTDDVQVLPDSISPSGRALSSPQVLGCKDVTSAPGAVQEPEVPIEKASPPAELHITDAATADAHSYGSDAGPGPLVQDEEAKVEFGGSERDGPEPDERQSQEQDDKSDRISVTKNEVEEEEEEVGAPEGEEALLSHEESHSPEDSRDASEEPVPLYEDEAEEEKEEEDEMDRSDEGAGYEDEYEEDYGEEELDDKPQYEYYESGSEVESGYEEELQPRSAPKSAEPEIIVLDSDSEDELSTQRPDDRARREDEEEPDGSYDSEEQVELEEDIYDGPDLVDESEEDQEDMEDIEDLNDVEDEVQDEPNQDYEEVEEDQEYEMGNRPDDEGTENDRSPVYERPAEAWRIRYEHQHKDIHDKESTANLHEPAGDQSELEMDATSPEPLGNLEQRRAPNEPPAHYEYPEDLHSMAHHPHDSLDYLAAISESAERIETVSEAVQQVYEMAIDPSLYALETAQKNLALETGAEDHSSELAAEASSAAPESPESKRTRDLALQLDGASPAIVARSTEAAIAIPTTPYAAEQLATPGPSQPVEAVETPTFVETEDQVLLTPELTQPTSTLEPADEVPPAPVATRAISVSEEGSPSLAITVKVESTHEGPEQGIGDEPEASMVVVGAPESVLSGEDQKLQASIEVDHEIASDINATDRSPADRHYPGLRSKLSYFAPLATLIDHYNALVDTISIASEVQPAVKAASGKKDFILTLQLTDPSMAGTAIYAQILRPYKSALPLLQEGDAILLRNFRVKSFGHSVILISDSTSAWAVYSAPSEEPEVTGPPIELGSEEKAFATDLRQWYLEGGMAMVADNQLQASIGRESREGTPDSSIAQSDAGDMDMALREVRGDTSSSRGSRRRKSHRRITIHELRDGRRYTEVGSSPGEGSIHELRDGTVYANL
ncbi:hypothetical protein BJY01DRAFT_176388 [Aspergillus pseudoustus]|uniref:Telomeric single stranded DNA binding POT1/Cdc13 domain-containing protein n=1 Tax=Aspergillus pseudoustus TaxID=1810923 RepID=A0ABR4K1B6_9EURO